tara:strand:+ start:419 stop:1186 length:768 start_codon:yes stop_codon:yes gene_type:complete
MSTQAVDFLEITADHFMESSRERDRLFDELRETFTLIPHGLNLSLGSAEGFNAQYLSLLAEVVTRVDPPWWSEHISFTQAGGVEIGHLSPVPFNREGMNSLCQNITRAREIIQQPLILENITYTMQLPWSDIEEGEFLAELLERTDCGLLLDVTNLYTNSVNHEYDAIRFLEQLPPDRVVQLHYVGGEQHEDGHLIDNHSHPTPDPVWELMGEVFKRFPVKGAILERDANFPEFDSLLEEVDRCRRTAQEAGRWT